MICELCGTEYDDEEKVCPSCGAANPLLEDEQESEEDIEAEVDASEGNVPAAPGLNPLEGRVDLDDELEQQGVVPVFRAPDEMTASIVRGLLESEGIPVDVASRQVPWMDGIMTTAVGYFGDLLVPASEADRAREIIEAYESAGEKTEEDT